MSITVYTTYIILYGCTIFNTEPVWLLQKATTVTEIEVSTLYRRCEIMHTNDIIVKLKLVNHLVTFETAFLFSYTVFPIPCKLHTSFYVVLFKLCGVNISYKTKNAHIHVLAHEMQCFD